jgi:putative thioredoxin
MHIDVTTTSFEADVVTRSREVPVVVDFWAPWCGPCRTLGPVLERLAAQAAGRWVLAKVNTDENRGLAQRFQIQGIPAVKAFVNGAVAAEFVGALGEAQVRSFLDKVVPDEAAVAAASGARAAQAGDPSSAEAAFRAALNLNATQPDALLWLAERAVDGGRSSEAVELLSRMKGPDLAARLGPVAALRFRVEARPLAEAAAAFAAGASVANEFALGEALAAAGDWEGALEHFLAVVRRDRAFGGDAGRKAMLQVFDVLGPTDPRADGWRRKLSMELFK